MIYTSNIQKVKQRWPEMYVTQQLDDIWNDPEIELVVIATPNLTHVSLIEQSLQSGKHTVVDKPFVLHAADGERLIRLAEQKGLQLSVYHNRRWDHGFLTVQKLIREHRMGEILQYESHYDRYRPEVRDRWKEKSQDGGGTFYDLGSHLIDQAIVLFGLPSAVTADCGIQRTDGQGTDYFHVTLSYEDKLRVILRSSSFVRNKGPKFIVHGSKASFCSYGEDPQEQALIAGASPYDDSYGQVDPAVFRGTLYFNEGEVGEHVQAEQGGYHRYYELMAEAIITGREVPVQPSEALQVIRVIELAERSSREGRTLMLDNTE